MRMLDKEKYAIHFATERAEGKEEGKQIGSDKKARIVAKRLIIDGMPLEKVAKMTELDIEVVKELAKEVAENPNENA